MSAKASPITSTTPGQSQGRGVRRAVWWKLWGARLSTRAEPGTGARVEFVFPVAKGNWLLLQGAGGLSGYSELELGLRTQVRGNGNRGSHYLTLVVGGSEVRTQTCNRDIQGSWCFDDPSVSGAHFGFGLESRL